MRIQSVTFEKTLCFRDKHKVVFNNDVNIFVGPNGCGKSALLEVVSTLLKRVIGTWVMGEFTGNGGRKFRPQLYSDTESLENALPLTSGMMGTREFEMELVCDEHDVAEIQRVYESKKQLLEMAIQIGAEGVFHKIEQIRPVSGPFIHKYTVKSDGSSPSLDSNSDEFVFRLYLQHADGLSTLFQLSGIQILQRPFLLFPSSRTVDAFQNSIILSNTEDLDNRLKTRATYKIRNHSTSYYSIALARLGSLYLDCLHSGRIDDFKKSSMWARLSDNLKILNIQPAWDTINQHTNEYRLVLNGDGKEIPYQSHSLGERQLIHFIVCLSCVGCDNGIVLIDEPELNLHPRWQDLVYKILTDVSRKQNTQTLIATHSSRFISSTSFCKTIRINKNSEGVVISDGHQSYLNIDSIKLSRMISANNNERLFFADRVLFVEGPTDTLIFGELVSAKIREGKLKTAIEVISVEGKSQIRNYLKLASHFKIPAIAVADFDFIEEDPSLRDLLIQDSRSIVKEIKQGRSRDANTLISELELAISSGNTKALSAAYSFLKAKNSRVVANSAAAEERVAQSRRIFQSQGIYILANGDIEDYLPDGIDKNHLDMVADYCSDHVNFSKPEMQRFITEWETIWAMLMSAR